MVTGMTFLLSVTSTPIYQATTILQIDYGADPRTDAYSALRTGELSAKTYVEQLKSQPLLRDVISALNLPMTEAQLQNAISVQQVRDTQLIQINVEDSNPGRAQAIANRLAEAFLAQIAEKQQARYASAMRDLNSQIADLEASIAEAQKAIASLGDPKDPKNASQPEMVRLELTRLQTNLTNYQTRYTILLRSAEDFRLAAAQYSDNITVFSPAELPRAPVKPNIPLNVVLGLISGLVLGVSSAFLLDYLDDTIKNTEDVVRTLGLTALANVGRVPGVKELKDCLITGMSGRSAIAEAYRVLRTNLQFSQLGNPAATLLVTSAGPGEGKSTTLANLGIVLAQSGKRVVLVDSDLRRPSLHRFFAVPQSPGLTSLLLQDPPDVATALQPTGVDGLQVITSGPIPPNPAEVLVSPRMAQIAETLKHGADYVLFDSPPVLAVTDATLLAAGVGGVLLVIDAGETRSDAAIHAKEMLGRVKAPILGVVLNKQQSRNGGGYYYYYYYGEGGEKKRRKDGDRRQKEQERASVSPGETDQGTA
jgi:non-specific protein-tyrosine kinase